MVEQQSKFLPELLAGFDENQSKHESGSYIHNRERLERWDNRYIELAAHVASWSKDDSKVGCVIVSPTYGRAITFSFNGFPANVSDSEKLLAEKDEKLPRTLHAEQNALLYAGREARGCHAYVFGKPVCNTCAILLIQAGVKRVIAAAPKAEGTYSPSTDQGAVDWNKLGRIGLMLFHEAGVGFKPIDPAKVNELVERYSLKRNQPETPASGCDCCPDGVQEAS